MPSVNFASIVDFCIRRRWWMVLASALILAVSAVYVARNFTLNSDVNALLSPHLPWRQRQIAYDAAFPAQATSILALVSAPTPEFATAAAAALTDRLRPQSEHFRSVSFVQGGAFFARNGLLYLSEKDLAERMLKLSRAAPLVRMLVADPSLRGLTHVLSLSLQGVAAGRISLNAMARPLNMIAETVEDVLAGRGTFSWLSLINGVPTAPQNLNLVVDVWPVLNYRAIEPGQAAAAAVSKAARDAQLVSKYDAAVRLTGPIPLADAQFATLRQGVAVNAVITAAIILLVLWLALGSVRIVAAAIVTIFVGLVATAALGLLLAGAFNPISVAFAMLFVGLGADFAIQFSVRYRAQRHEVHDLRAALVDGARYVGAPLTLAAIAAAAGFLSFLPTDYRGVAELGLISGVGMLVAYVAAMTLLPALLSLFKAPPEPYPLGYAAMAAIDRFMQRHRVVIVAITSFVVIAALPSLLLLRFNFDPNSLQPPHSPAVVALRQLGRDTGVKFETANVLTPPAAAAAVVKRVAALPQVGGTRNLDSFIPEGQAQKIATIGKAAAVLDPALHAAPEPGPSDSEDVAALRNAAANLRATAGKANGAGANAAMRLARDLDALAAASAQTRGKAQAAFIAPLQIDLHDVAASLHPQTVMRSNLPRDLVREWIAPNGDARTEILPKGNTSNTETIRNFARAVLAVEPHATGEAIQIYEWGNTVTAAFIKAGVLAICSIALLLLVVLRRIADMLVTLIPLLVATAATLEISALTGFALNYANIIALPALLGVGVAFKIYYVMAWRRGEHNFLQSSLTRAVFFSALMTATAFGSLWFSAHPGISSMGKLLALSLACTLASAALFQPALMGPPRAAKGADSASPDRNADEPGAGRQP
jgi:hopanoid biosynthesis associated RND transporter like protein HpnN